MNANTAIVNAVRMLLSTSSISDTTFRSATKFCEKFLSNTENAGWTLDELVVNQERTLRMTFSDEMGVDHYTCYINRLGNQYTDY